MMDVTGQCLVTVTLRIINTYMSLWMIFRLILFIMYNALMIINVLRADSNVHKQMTKDNPLQV